MVWAIIIIVLLSGADQLLKELVKTNIAPTDSIPVIEGFFNLINVQNSGAAWSFLSDKAWGLYFLIGISSLFTLAILFIIWRSKNIKINACLTIISAGSIGNLIDRIRDRGVTDYLDFHFGSYIFPTFNLADMMVVCGAILLGFLIMFDHSILQHKPAATASMSDTDTNQTEEDTHASDHSD